MNTVFTFWSDPSHGWLEVPISLLVEFKIAHKITPYSYRHDKLAYLEEDCDAGQFLQAAKEVGMEVSIRDRQSNYPSEIREYDNYYFWKEEGP